MKNPLRATVVGLLCLAPLLGWSTQTRAQGEGLYQSRCAACHQADGVGSAALKAPNLTGLSRSYLGRQLTHFRDKLRGFEVADSEGQTMRAASQGLTDEDIAALSGYITQLPLRMAPSPRRTASLAGRGKYSGCSSCHGAQAKGIDDLGAPRLQGQFDWYLKAQLVKFRSSLRGAHPQDTFGQQMRAMAHSIASDADLDPLVWYIGGLGR